MQAPRPKQYLPLLRQRVMDYALLALCQSDLVDGVIVGVRDGDRWWQAQPFTHAKLMAVSRGGAQRAHTVCNALQQLLQDDIAAPNDWVMVHDAVRPCLRALDIERLVAAARAHGDGAVLAVQVVDALKQVRGDGLLSKHLHSAGRHAVWRAVTPQMFRCGALHAALQQALAHGVAPPDEAAAMEKYGVTAVVVAAHPANLKITLPVDLELAEMVLPHFHDA